MEAPIIGSAAFFQFGTRRDAPGIVRGEGAAEGDRGAVPEGRRPVLLEERARPSAVEGLAEERGHRQHTRQVRIR